MTEVFDQKEESSGKGGTGESIGKCGGRTCHLGKMESR